MTRIILQTSTGNFDGFYSNKDNNLTPILKDWNNVFPTETHEIVKLTKTEVKTYTALALLGEKTFLNDI